MLRMIVGELDGGKRRRRERAGLKVSMFLDEVERKVIC